MIQRQEEEKKEQKTVAQESDRDKRERKKQKEGEQREQDLGSLVKARIDMNEQRTRTKNEISKVLIKRSTSNESQSGSSPSLLSVSIADEPGDEVWANYLASPVSPSLVSDIKAQFDPTPLKAPSAASAPSALDPVAHSPPRSATSISSPPALPSATEPSHEAAEDASKANKHIVAGFAPSDRSHSNPVSLKFALCFVALLVVLLLLAVVCVCVCVC